MTRWFIASALLSAIWAGALSAQEAADVAPIQLEQPLRLKAGDAFIDTGRYVAHAGPLAVDLNADGKPDLLVGNFGGHFQVYLNIGSRAQPEYEDQGLLEAGGATAKVPNW
jgi:hypothetical protein